AAFRGQSSLCPSVPTADERGGIVVTFLVQFLHRTGAGVLVPSSTVRDDQLVLGKLRDALLDLSHRDDLRAGDVPGVVRRLPADVEDDCPTFIDGLTCVIDADAANAV